MAPPNSLPKKKQNQPDLVPIGTSTNRQTSSSLPTPTPTSKQGIHWLLNGATGSPGLQPSRGHPIEWLPRELLLEIFLLTLVGALIQKSPIFVLSGVSRRWRELVNNAPELWRTIRISFSGTDKDARLATPVQLHLDRSRHRPLVLSVTLEEDTEEYQYIGLVLDLLSSHCKRWFSIELDLPEELIFAKLLAVRGKLPLLRHLGFTLFEEPAQPAVQDLFEDCPSLATVQIGKSFPLHLPWTNLTRMYDMPVGSFQVFPGGDPIILPNLLALTLSATDVLETTLLNIISRLQLPGLEEFYFNNVTENVWRFLPTRGLRALIASTKRLKRLKFSYLMCPEEDLLDILRETSELEEITLWPSTPLDQRFGTRLLKGLAQVNDGTHVPIISPKLAQFTYGSVGGAIDPSAFYAFFWSRFMGRADEGRQVTITLYRTDYMEFVPVVSRLIREGGTNLYLNIFGNRHITLFDQIFFVPGNCVIKNAAYAVKVGRYPCLLGNGSERRKPCETCKKFAQTLR